MARLRLPAYARVMRRVSYEDRGYATPCRIFLGSKDKLGYGRIHRSGIPELVHRIVYEQERGEIPDGLVIDHLCRVPACCNPDHLEPVTQRENVRRGRGSETTKRYYAAQERCVHGHQYDEANTRWRTTRGYRTRTCRTCEQAYRDNRRSTSCISR